MGAITELSRELGLRPGRKTITPAIERASSEFYRGFLRGLFDTERQRAGHADEGCVGAPRAAPTCALLEGAQRMLLRLGIAASMYERAQHELVITGENVARFAEVVGFADTVKRARLARLLGGYKRTLNRERFVATVESVRADGMEDVYDVQIPGINEFDANGFHAHNCGEQPLPPYGSCLLGSVNLTRFVKNAFTDFAEFDWNEYREVVKVFTRMLDNVCEINGLPLEQQRMRDHAQAPPRHGLPRARQHHHLPRHEVRRGRFGEVHRRRLARNGRGRLGSRARSREREGPGAHHERRVHASRPRCCASVRRWRRTAGRSAT